MPDIDLPTVIFALVALFVAYKLRSVLGMRNDGGRPGGLLAPLRRAPGPAPPAVAPIEAEAPAPAPTLPVAADRWKNVADPDAWNGLDAIAAADKGFPAQAFLSGARAAYDMVVHAFAAGDSATLRGLMAPEAFANFDAAIRARAAAGHTMTTTVRVDRRRHDRRRAARRPERPDHRALCEQARLGHPRRRRNRRRRLADGGRRPPRPVDLRPRRALARSELAADGDPVGTLTLDGGSSRASNRSDFDGLAGFGDDDHLAAFRCFERSARALVEGSAAERAGPKALRRADRSGRGRRSPRLPWTPRRAAFLRNPLSAVPHRPRSAGAGFLTGYYEPCVAGSPVETDAFRWPILARPRDLVSFAPGETPAGLSRGRHRRARRSDGSLVPYDDREAIERERRDPIVWLRDAVEAFLIQVQGSAQVEFRTDGGRGSPMTAATACPIRRSGGS